MPTGTFTFSEYDFGNSSIVPESDHTAISFTMRTKRGIMDRPKLTTLSSSHSVDADLQVGGAIDWKKKTMEVTGMTRPLAEVRHRVGGTFSL